MWGRLWTHWGNAFCEEAVKIIGSKSGAFEVVATDDPRALPPENLQDAGGDAVCNPGTCLVMRRRVVRIRRRAGIRAMIES